jgi:FkbM family methyltransferase
MWHSTSALLTAPLPPRAAPANDPASLPFGAFAPTRAQAAIIAMVHRLRVRRGVFRPMLSRLINRLRAGPIDVQFHGASFRLFHQTSATERGALFNPDYNREELDFLQGHTPAGGVFVDLGANVGTYAMVMARHVGPSGTVIAIEPHPVTLARLAFNRAASRLAHVDIVAAAVGACDGALMIGTDRDNLAASRVVSNEERGSAIRVPSRRLQRIIIEAGVDHVDSLKIDVEGFEDRVLTGFFAEAPQNLWPRAVVIEHLSRNEWLKDCIAGMRSLGYSESRRNRSNTMLVRV